MDPADAVRAYYAALDGHDYDALSEQLAADFVQRRPDRTFESRDAFVSFMRDDRPRKDTTHAVDAVYERGDDGEGDRRSDGGRDGDDREGDAVELAVRGRLLADGDELVGFVDVHRVEAGRLVELRTYSF